jgi:RecA-family ATPase
MTNPQDDPFKPPPEYPFTEARTHHDGRTFIRQSDGRWLDDWGDEVTFDPLTGKATITPNPIEPYTAHSYARWKDKEIHPPLWFMEDWIPLGRPVGLYGKPGARKSTLMLQWMIACQLGKKFGNIETPLAYGPAYGLFCEDDEEIIAWRGIPMLKAYGATWDDMRDCHPESLVDANLSTFCTFSQGGVMRLTPAWRKFIADIEAIRPVFVCLDILADFFGGDEIRRREASAFVSLLHKTAREYRFACVYSAHPSLTGISSKTMMSGTTGFEGKVGARMTLIDPTDEENEDDPIPNQSDRRTLTLAKANYARPGASIDLVFEDGHFIPEALAKNNKSQGPADKAAAESAFLTRLKAQIERGIYLSPSKTTAVYAPKLLAGDGYSARTLEAAMNRLLAKGTLTFNPDRRGTKRWIISD